MKFRSNFFLEMIAEVVVVAALLSVCDGQQQQLVEVKTPEGTFVGYRADFGDDTSQLYYGQADVFLGIPYVEKPERFSRPVARLANSTAVHNATQFGAICPQPNAAFPMDEDCLFLNIFSPNVTSLDKRPVMLWIHGGAFRTGSAMDYEVEGIVRNLVTRNVVVVTIQYRLGPLGFFTVPTPSNLFPANLGLLDQVEAIKWVNREIENFGGDKNKVLLFGESAGGASVSAHTFSPLSRDYFQMAIMQSGPIYACYDGHLMNSENSENEMKNLCNMSTADAMQNETELMNCLMAASVTQLIVSDPGGLTWTMSVDGYFLPRAPEEMRNETRNIPVMLGTTRDEWFAFDVMPILFTGEVSPNVYGANSTEMLFGGLINTLGSHTDDAYRLARSVVWPDDPAANDTAGWLQLRSDLMSGPLFTSGTAQQAEWQLQNGNKNVFLYDMYYSPNHVLVTSSAAILDGWKPVPHGSEVPYLFMSKNFWVNDSSRLTPSDYAIADFFSQTWTNFAKFAFENNTSMIHPQWKPLVANRDRELAYLEIDVQPLMRDDYRTRDRDVWNSMIPTLQQIWNEEEPPITSVTVTGSAASAPRSQSSDDNQQQQLYQQPQQQQLYQHQQQQQLYQQPQQQQLYQQQQQQQQPQLLQQESFNSRVPSSGPSVYVIVPVTTARPKSRIVPLFH